MEDVELNNVCSTGASDQLLKAVISNDLGLFKKLLEIGLGNSSIDLNTIYNEPYYGTILDICCMSAGRSEFAKVLLSIGVDVNVINNNRRKAPIHLAAENGSTDSLHVLLEHDPTDINLLDGDKNSALHLTAKAGQFECTKLLLNSKNIKPNQLNKKGFTPAYLAAISKNKNDDLMLAFIRCPKVDLDVQIRDKSLRDVIGDKYPHLIEEMPLEGTRNIIEPCDDNMFVYLYSNDVENFTSQISSKNQHDLNSHDGKHTYLQYACDFGMPQIVEALLEHGADPNGICPFNTKYPMFIASFRGFANIIQLFLNSKKSICYQTDNGNVLHEVVKGSDENHNSLDVNVELCDHSKAFKILLEKSKLSPYELDINQSDDKGNTCLHYAAKVGDRDSILSLLECGAYVGKRNIMGDPPLADINPKILESHLNSCIKTNGKSPKDANYEIICSYDFLCPPKIYKRKDNDNYQTQLEGQEYSPENIPETDPLLYISEVPELRPLLKHPVLTSFLHLKWFAIKRYYKVNIAFYVAFWALLTVYTLLTFRIGVRNTDSALTQNYTTEFSTNKVPNSNNVTAFLWIMVLAFLIVLVIRELFQLISSPFAYVTSLENWLEISLIVVTSILLLSEISTVSNRSQISAVVILLSWGELILLVGRHPALATHLEMFKRVTKNFLQFLVWYSILIVAFALSFYMLFRNDEDNDNKFNHPSLATFKTIVMLTGEFDTFGSLPFNLHPIVSHALFLLFIFLIAIVLVNLLNGLAVSDTQAIRADAEIVAHVSRVKLIHYFETMAIEDPFSWIHKAQNHLTNFGYATSPICSRRFNLKIRLFPDALQDSEIKILPNQRNFVDFGLSTKKSQTGCLAKCQGYYMEKEIVNDAKAIVKMNSEETEKNCMEILDIFIDRFNNVEKAVEEIKSILSAMNSKTEINSISSSTSSPMLNGSYVNV